MSLKALNKIVQLVKTSSYHKIFAITKKINMSLKALNKIVQLVKTSSYHKIFAITKKINMSLKAYKVLLKKRLEMVIKIEMLKNKK